MKKVAIYVRLSKEDHDKVENDSESIINQRLLLTDYAIANNFEIYDTYSDDDYSGLYDIRPEFERMIRDAKLGMFHIVLCKSQSRFSRNMEHMERYMHMFELLNIRFISVVDNIDTFNKGSKKSRQINSLVNEWYCEDISESIRAVFLQKMKDGKSLSSTAPYGYVKDVNDGHKWIVDQYAAGVVKNIYKLFLQGFSIRSICHILEDEGVENPTVYKKQRGIHFACSNAKYDTMWSVSTIKRILENESYLGVLQQHRYEKVSYKDKKVRNVPKDQWICVENHHEAIIEKDTFYKVQQLKNKRRIVAVNQEGNKKVHLFAGKLRCADCGSTIMKSGGVRGDKEDWYMRCQLANKSRKTQCTSHNIRYKEIYEVVLSEIKSMVNCYKKDQRIVEEVSRQHTITKIMNDKNSIIKQLEKQLEENTNAILLLYHDRANGIIDESMFVRLKNKIDIENQSKNKQIQNLKNTVYELTNKMVDVPAIIHKYTTYDTLTHEMVNDFIDYIEVFEKQNGSQVINIYYNF